MNSIVLSGFCRCCASEGASKDLTSQYHWMGDEEIYSKMLRDCFDISLLNVKECGDSGGICEVCITQLRSSYNFKKQVLLTETIFKKRIKEKTMKRKSVEGVDIKDVKIEVMVQPDSDSDGVAGGMDDHDDSVSDQQLSIKTEMVMMEMADDDKKHLVEISAQRAVKPSTSTTKKDTLKTKKHRDEDDPYVCHCGARFTKLSNKKRHLLTAHGMKKIVTSKVLCDTCGKLFFNKEYLADHLAKGCKNRCCVRCDLDFDTKASMLQHMREKHWIGKIPSIMKCPLCDVITPGHTEHDKHLFNDHSIELDYQELTFDRIEDFVNWKDDLEKKENVYFLKCSSPNYIYYRCHPKNSIRKVRIDSVDSKSCPARINVRKEAGLYLVSYQSVHICGAEAGRRNMRNQLGCPNCSVQLDTYTELCDHLGQAHGYDMEISNLEFESRDGPAAKRKKKKTVKESATPERTEHRVNVTTILQHSNASPFRDKKMKGFSCLYCAKYFPDINDLRRHTAQKSEKDKLNTMIDYKLSYNPIKVDITDLQCTLCDQPMRDLNELKDHLVAAHKKAIYKDIKDIILPFRLLDGTNFTCVICSVVHVSFKNLYHHMSSHYRNYCCNKCGDGYITIAALRKHMKTHENGSFKCAYCDKMYTSKAKRKNHEKGVHTGGWLRNKCPHCPKIFVSYYERGEHMVEVHNEARVIYPCNACSKVYKKKYELSRHIKHHHLQQKNYMCDVCNATFFSKRGLVDHVQRHMGNEIFTCDVCGKTFSRYRNLKEHVKGHEENNRYQCEVCKKTFMQKCSLKSHVRLHQDDLDIFKEFDDVKHLIDNRDLTLKQIAAESKMKEDAEKANQASVI